MPRSIALAAPLSADEENALILLANELEATHGVGACYSAIVPMRSLFPRIAEEIPADETTVVSVMGADALAELVLGGDVLSHEEISLCEYERDVYGSRYGHVCSDCDYE